MCPRALREAAWQRLASDLERSRLAAITRDIGLADAIDAAPEVLAGRVRGRLVVDVSR
jgi:acrylyl-CoA reductase (NADPH)